ncbi:LOW QUALITY PROTEIN: late embryogenesis abundant protein 2-like [Cucurbita moschata]|uniref:LOW QUALITY PROTEIN: late embryogenesis abundant protein 2-like n=1 Tax=Cucurbita moschata TaxID=3662 RepID=A0A6J1FHD4_CUCMO|nr:LOW QUALITY PROTEIN: late embryogenesis abundant protein 2-like [Cucurbita moschata]
MADNSSQMSYRVGEAKGQTQEKVSNMNDTVAKESVQETGQQMKAKAQGAADAVKDAVNK